jgi:hypothetical protein
MQRVCCMACNLPCTHAHAHAHAHAIYYASRILFFKLIGVSVEMNAMNCMKCFGTRITTCNLILKLCD